MKDRMFHFLDAMMAVLFKESWRKESDRAHRASLDENDPALVEAIAKALSPGWRVLTEFQQDAYREDARAAIVAARNHITGGGA